MDHRVPELEARVAALAEALHQVEERLKAVERASGRAQAARRAVGVEAKGLQAAVAGPRADVPSAASAVSFVGRTLLVLAGGFVLRALTDAGTLAAPIGVASGLAYAGAFVLLADRAGRSGAKWSAGFHGAAAVLIGFPLLFEGTFRFRILSPGQAAVLLFGLTGVALAVAARRRLEGLAWLVSLAGVGTAAALALAPLGGRALLPTLYVVLLGGAALWLGYVLDWRGPRWPVAVAADLLVVVLSLRAGVPGAVEGPGSASFAQAALLLVYLGSVAARTLFLGRRVVPFEVVQTGLALAAGLGGAAYVAARAGGGALGFAVVSVAAGVAAYGVAFAFVERREQASANFGFYTSAALALVLAGTALALPGDALALVWAALGVGAAVLARRHRRLTLGVHAAVYAVAAALGSGLLVHAAHASFSPVGEPWGPVTPPALLVLLAVAATTWLAAGATARRHVPERLPQLALFVVTACAASGVLVGWLAPVLAVAPSAASAGAVATLRTAVWVGGALLLGWLGRRAELAEAGWLTWPVLAATGLKILLEDLPRSRPATLFVAFAIYGTALIVVARTRQRPRARASATS